MSSTGPEWLAPETLEEALVLKAERGADVTVVAGGTFVGILVNQRLLLPDAFLSLRHVRHPALQQLSATPDGELALGALVTHREVELSPVVREGWPALAKAFSLVASPRVRNQATVGGVLADADHASDPPSMLLALGARAVARSLRGEREIPIDELIVGFYETTLAPDELLVEIKVPKATGGWGYEKFTRRAIDWATVAVAAVRTNGGVSVALANMGPTALRATGVEQALASGAGTADAAALAAEGTEPPTDVTASADYRRHLARVLVARALEQCEERS